MTAYGLEEFFDFLTIRVTLIRILVQRIEALRHDFCAMLKAHTPLVTVVKCIQFGLGDGRSLTEFTLAIVMVNPCYK
jgi:hypothetical protein